MTGILADLAELARNPRAWWHRATHSRCPDCGQTVSVRAAEWYAHKATHHPETWQPGRPR